jgi:hypothetical protein
MTLEAQCIRCRHEVEVDNALQCYPAEGWDLVSAVHSGPTTFLYFKRKKPQAYRPLIAKPEDRLA